MVMCYSGMYRRYGGSEEVLVYLLIYGHFVVESKGFFIKIEWSMDNFKGNKKRNIFIMGEGEVLYYLNVLELYIC